MKAVRLQECTGSMMNAKEDIVYLSGEIFALCLIIFQFLQLLTREFFACMVVCHLN